jgi:hypothetical protein
MRTLVDLAIEDAVWDHPMFSKNRDRLLENEIVEAFVNEVLGVADKRGLLSREHFSVDGTLVQVWASHKSFCHRTARMIHRAAGGTLTKTGKAGGSATTRTNRAPIRMRDCSGRAEVSRPSCATTGTC